ncbi:amino acid permease-domain-containing protein [Coniella lustricola]|uniref:Amino acid permease-domain-containing protein n=1 Tax=Coniella lustricola TaxID=2025994 RepID=A0A2T3A3B0_9PEZI|nr:amino acid permease-domain-containing protein [Coniella lustricola]
MNEKTSELESAENEAVVNVGDVNQINAAGYRDQLKRQYSLVGIAGLALTIDNAWVALGSSISVSIENGGIPGLIYGLMIAILYYAFINLSLAELASSVPTAGGVYHWATIAAGPRWGRVVGFYIGWINFYGWMFGLASLVQIASNTAVQMFATLHPSYISEAWHVYIGYLLVLWLCTVTVTFANKGVPYTQQAGMFLVVIGGVVTVVALAAMPRQHASNEFVWASFTENNLTGWQGGLALLMGVLNGAFTIGTADGITHVAEELPQPGRDLPKAMGIQLLLGGLYAIVFAIALGYSINDISALIGNSNSFPLAVIYLQATNGSAGATVGLLSIILLSTICGCVGTVLTNSRIYWALARDNAVPFSTVFSSVDERFSCPIWATLFVAIVATGLGAIPLGSPTAFINLTGSFIALTTISYLLPILANIMTRRRYFPPGPFNLGRFGYVINTLTVIFIIFFDILFCFPYTVPTTKTTMNYNSVIIVSILMLSTMWWILHGRRNYPGPKVMHLYIHAESSLRAPSDLYPTGDWIDEPDRLGLDKRPLGV